VTSEELVKRAGPKDQGSAVECHNSKVTPQRDCPPPCVVWNWDPYLTGKDLGTVRMVWSHGTCSVHAGALALG